MSKKLRPKKPKCRLRFKAYDLVAEKLEEGLGFAMNRLVDAGVQITEEQREAALPFMLNELQVALSDIDWERSG